MERKQRVECGEMVDDMKLGGFNLGKVRRYIFIRVFLKNTFSKKKKLGNTLTYPSVVYIKHIQKLFSVGQVKKGTPLRTKINGPLQYRFSLSLLSAWPGEG